MCRVGVHFVLSVCRYHVLKMQDKNKVSEKKAKQDIATDIAGAVNEASIEMNCSIDKSREGMRMRKRRKEILK